MSLTPDQIYTILNETATNLGYTDVQVSDSNVNVIGLASPNDINNFISALNLVINNRFYQFLGSFSSFVSRFKKNISVNGAGTSNYNFSAPSLTTYPNAGKGGDFNSEAFKSYNNNSLSKLVASESNFQKGIVKNFIVDINERFNPMMTIDKRELSKIYTANGLIKYVSNVYDYLSNSFDMFLYYKIIDNFMSNNSKMVRMYQGATSLTPIAILNASTSLITPETTAFLTSATTSIPTSVNSGYIASEKDLLALMFTADGKGLYYSTLHFKPDVEFMFLRRNSNTYGADGGAQPVGLIINEKAVNVDIFTKSVSEFNVPNEVNKINVYFNSDIAIKVNYSIPMIAFMSGNIT